MATRSQTSLAVAMRSMRDKFNYDQLVSGKPLWEVLGYETKPKDWQIQALFIKLINEKATNDTNIDVLLAAYGFLKGYESLTPEQRREQFLKDNIEFFKENWPDHYEKSKSETDKTRKTAIENACGNLRYRQDTLIDKLADIDIKQIPDMKSYIANIENELLENTCKSDFPKPRYLKPEREIKAIKQECKEAICAQIDQFICSDVYFESHIRDITFTIDDSLKQYSRNVLTRSVLVNPRSEDNIYYSLDVNATFRELHEGDELQVIREKYRSDLKITVNKMPLRHYLLQLGKLYPDKYSSYLNISDDWDIYSLFSVAERHDSDGLVADTELSFKFPLDRNVEKHDIKVEYVAHTPLIIGRIGGVIRINYPCKYLEHNYAIRFNRPDAWEISFYVLEPFYFTSKSLNPHKERSFSVDRNHRQIASVKMNYLILPGSGYAYRILLKGLINGDSFTPEFLRKARLLGKDIECDDFLE